MDIDDSRARSKALSFDGLHIEFGHQVVHDCVSDLTLQSPKVHTVLLGESELFLGRTSGVRFAPKPFSNLHLNLRCRYSDRATTEIQS